MRVSSADALRPLYVQYGCGLSCPVGWLNFDISPRLRLENSQIVGWIPNILGSRLFPKDILYGDIIRGLPVPKNTAAGVFCSHVLEHIDRENIDRALTNTLSILRPGGVFRLVVPDLAWRARRFLEGHHRRDPFAADIFMQTTHLGISAPLTGVMRRLRALYGNSAHRWMYDYYLMHLLLDKAGFVEIRRCAYGDAEDPMFAKVEERGRFYDSNHEELAIEARRPS